MGMRPRARPGQTTPPTAADRPAGDQHERPRATTAASRTREAGAAAIRTVGAGAVLLALLVLTVAVLIALLIGLAIVFADVNANRGNTIVKGIDESANFFAGSFTGMIRFSGHPDRAISVNWGIAALVFLFAGAVLARVIFAVGRGGIHAGQRRRASATNY